MSDPPVASNSSKTKLEENIRALTTAIYLLQPQYAASETLYDSQPTKHGSLSRAYNYLAILLTRGSEAHPGAASEAVAVTGTSSGSGFSFSVLEVIDDLAQLPSNQPSSFTQNANKGPGIVDYFEVKEIQPSAKSLDELADPKYQPTSPASLTEHASDVFKALIDLSEDIHRVDTFMRFVWLRFQYKIKHRIAADEEMLGKPLHTLLGEWKLEDSDVVEEQWFDVDPHTHHLHDLLKIPSRPHHETRRQYLFSRSTIPPWCSLFIRVLRTLKSCAAGSDMQTESIMKLNRAFYTLHALLYDNNAFQTLLGLPSLTTAVYVAMSSAEHDRRRQRPEKPFDAPLDDAFVADDSTGNPVLRCCKAVLEWFQAAVSLSRSKVLRGPLPKFHVVRAYLPQNKSMTALEDLMMNVILPNFGGGADNEVYVQGLLKHEDFARKNSFAGKPHCEATLMALVHSFTTSVSPVLPCSEQIARELSPLFSNADRVVDVGKKSCFCCYWLAQFLNEGGTFLVPGTHGIVFPWTPPVFGIPVSVLEQLEDKLIQKLTEITEKWIASHPTTHTSRQSSPTSSVVDEDMEAFRSGIIPVDDLM